MLLSAFKIESAPKSLIKKYILAKAMCINHLNYHGLKAVVIDNQLLNGL